MKDRIQRIIDEKNLTPSRFADEVGLNRPAVSHILNGRNNPGLDALQHILHRYPEINGSWLITGVGNMYNAVAKQENGPTLFDENPVFPSDIQVNVKDEQEIALNKPAIRTQALENQIIEPEKSKVIKVKKIAIFYADNTYQEFVPAENDR